MMKPPGPEKQLPYGVADLFFKEAAYKSKIEGLLKQTFDRWSYSEIIPPTFEYYEPLTAEASPQVREEIYRFFDRDGRMLALRADPTIPIARIVSTKLSDRPMPLRFFYVTNVFRHEEPKAALRREFTQAGVELIGAAGPEADAEVISLAVSALRAAGIREFRMRVGTMALIGALLDELSLSSPESDAVKVALERKSNTLLSQVLNGSPARPEMRRALTMLPHLMGGAEILKVAQRECAVNENALAAIEYLAQVHRYVQAQGCAESITYDLAMLRGMAYYTGIVFEGFVPGIGFSIMSGGRYDKLLSHFGSELPAMGFAIGVERAMAATDLDAYQGVDLCPQVLAEMGPSREVAIRVQEARDLGLRVEWSIIPRTHKELLAFALERGARQVWFATGMVEDLA